VNRVSAIPADPLPNIGTGFYAAVLVCGLRDHERVSPALSVVWLATA
jgi:hypothetical protein